MENYQLDLDGITPVHSLQFDLLDRRYKKCHIIGVSLVYLFIMALASMLMLIDIQWLFPVVECVIILIFLINMAILPESYRRKGYAFRDQDLSYRSGIVFPRVTTIPYVRIQQVSVKQNPVSKLFNLYSIEIVNGAQALSSMTIPGLSEERAWQIKNLLTGKLSKSHE